jgi:soluble cytochrome b562
MRRRLENVDDYIRNLLESHKQKLKAELEHHILVKSKDKEDEIRKNLESVVESDMDSKDRQEIDSRFEKLVEQLDKLDNHSLI